MSGWANRTSRSSLDAEQIVARGEREQPVDVGAGSSSRSSRTDARAERRDRAPATARAGRHGLQPLDDRRLEGVRQYTVPGGGVAGPDGARELEREQRVPADTSWIRRRVRARDRGDGAADDAGAGPPASSGPISSVSTRPGGRASAGASGSVRARAEPRRREHPERLAVEPAQRVAQRARRGGVEPLQVVDRERPRRAPPRAPRSASSTARPRANGSSTPRGRRVERAGARTGRRADERDRHLLLGGPRDQHEVAGRPAALHPVPPQGRFPRRASPGSPRRTSAWAPCGIASMKAPIRAARPRARRGPRRCGSDRTGRSPPDYAWSAVTIRRWPIGRPTAGGVRRVSPRRPCAGRARSTRP